MYVSFSRRATGKADLSAEPRPGCPKYTPAFPAGGSEEKVQGQGKGAEESALTVLRVDSSLCFGC